MKIPSNFKKENKIKCKCVCHSSGSRSFAKMKVGHYQKNCFCYQKKSPEKSKTESWGKEFRERFVAKEFSTDGRTLVVGGNPQDVESFIIALLQSEREKIIGEIKK